MSGPPKATPPPMCSSTAPLRHQGLTLLEWCERAMMFDREAQAQRARADSYKLECAALRDEMRRLAAKVHVEEQRQVGPPARAEPLRLLLDTEPTREATVLRDELHRAHDELFEAGKIIAGRDMPRTGQLFEGAAARIARLLARTWCAVCQKPLDMNVDWWRTFGRDLAHASCVLGAGPVRSAIGTQGNVAGPPGVEGEPGSDAAASSPHQPGSSQTRSSDATTSGGHNGDGHQASKT